MTSQMPAAAGRGAVAGTLATVVMSALMLVAQRLGLMGEQPPERITAEALDRLGAERSESTQNALASGVHLAFGAVAGAVYGVAVTRMPARAPRPVTGAAFGLGVWLISYAGWVPALRIMPPISDDRPGRPTSMALAHVVFGGVLDRLLRR